jgi:hypothetical protein
VPLSRITTQFQQFPLTIPGRLQNSRDRNLIICLLASGTVVISEARENKLRRKGELQIEAKSDKRPYDKKMRKAAKTKKRKK